MGTLRKYNSVEEAEEARKVYMRKYMSDWRKRRDAGEVNTKEGRGRPPCAQISTQESQRIYYLKNKEQILARAAANYAAKKDTPEYKAKMKKWAKKYQDKLKNQKLKATKSKENDNA